MREFDASKYAKENNIPEVIELKTRRGEVETKLRLVGFAMDEINYAVEAKYPYSLHRTSSKADDYSAIDFSEGPMLAVGGQVEGLEILHIGESYNGNSMLITIQHPDFKFNKD